MRRRRRWRGIFPAALAAAAACALLPASASGDDRTLGATIARYRAVVARDIRALDRGSPRARAKAYGKLSAHSAAGRRAVSAQRASSGPGSRARACALSALTQLERAGARGARVLAARGSARAARRDVARAHTRLARCNVPRPPAAPPPPPAPSPQPPPGPAAPRIDEVLGWSTSTSNPTAIAAPSSGGAIIDCGTALPRLALVFRYSGFSVGQSVDTVWSRDGAVLFLGRQALFEPSGVASIALPRGVRESGRYELQIRDGDTLLARAAISVACPPALEFVGWVTNPAGSPPPIVALDGGTISECGASRSQLGVYVRFGFLPAEATLQYFVTRDDSVIFEDKVRVEPSGATLLGIAVSGGLPLPNGRYAISANLVAGPSFGRVTVTLSCP